MHACMYVCMYMYVYSVCACVCVYHMYDTTIGLKANMKRAFTEIQPSFFEEHGKSHNHVITVVMVPIL